MCWANPYIEKLQQGEVAKFRPRGHSMRGKVSDGQLVTVEPFQDESEPEVGDVVLCRVRCKHYLHLVTAKQGEPSRFQIGNNRGKTNGWIGRNSVFGICTKVED